MSNPGTIFASMVVSMVSGRVAAKVFDSPMLGAVVGMAAGGFVYGAAAGGVGAAEGGMVGGSAETPVMAGSTLGGEGALANYEAVAGGADTGGAKIFAATETPDVMANAKAIDAAGNVIGPGQPQPGVLPGQAVKKPGLLGISNNEWLKFGGDVLSGYAEQDQADAIKKRYEDMAAIEREKLAMEEQKYQDQSAYGLTRDGRRVPLNVAEQLEQINQANRGTSLNRLSNIQGLLRQPSGYTSGYGRFQKPEVK